ncbi:hypothetical protein DFJ58DRAFT_35128 [Suillus subalutaceus]|uniref:uncharacterized protein n=1 Tax=Suillus subalutaceus TaxID=48586 RepID=UPI001B871BC3|nr:uncharacterized protein DFJ58DRAFT_35128 [Suillus subalutaceus]KAG1843805.1 hypothetical protein DFJ58DRAFT_35128 [Suillus subalutaceus]
MYNSEFSKLVTSSDGCEIFAEDVGNLEGPTVILVHGLGSYTVVFNNLFKDNQLLSKVCLMRYAKVFTRLELGRTVATDVCTHCSAGYLSGITYVSVLPCIGAIMMDLGKECLKNLHPRLLKQDVADAPKARIDFVDSTINDCNASRLLWVGAF